MIAVTIINYRTGTLTIAAAKSALEALSHRQGRVVIIDNASGDGSADEIASWIESADDSRLMLVRSQTNSGFSGGHNQGFKAVPDADYYLVLNSDALLRPGFFEASLEIADTVPEAGLIAPRLEDEDGTPQESHFRLASPVSELIRGARTGPVTRLFNRWAMPLGIDPDPKQVEWASFACILIRGTALRDVGPMDEGYFLYFEDSEYAMRMRRAGWTTALALEAHAVHFRGGSGPVKAQIKAKKRLPAYYWRSRSRFMRQAHGIAGPLLANLAWIVGRGVNQLRRLTGRAPTPAIEKEWRDIWLGTFRPLRSSGTEK